MAIVLNVERWCDTCDRLFRATLTIEGEGKESTRIESPCPDCGTPGRRLLKYDRP